jgi:phospholipid-translocating ATPase
MIPGLSTTGTYTTIVPLMIFVGISMAKEGYDDIRRWRLDKEENNRDTLILDREWRSGDLDKTRWKSTKWHDVNVGDVLLLQRNDPIPADLVLLHVDNLSQIAYIEVCLLRRISPEILINSSE